MKDQSFIFTSACLFIVVFFTSCHTTKTTASAIKYSRQPKFIKDMYLNGHNKSSSTANAIEPRKMPVHKPVKEEEEIIPEVKIVENKPVETIFVVSRPKVQNAAIQEPADLAADNTVDIKYADMIGMESKEITNHQLYKFIDKWYGTNYRLGGQTQSGIDCSGFAQKLYGEVYGMDLTRTAMDQYQNCKRGKKCDDPEEGDLVFFKQRSKRITHVGVYLANDYFVHASTSQGVIISSLKEEYWQRHYAGLGKMARAE